MAHQCHACGATVQIADIVSREDECDGCGADLRACINCRHYDPRYHNSCRETEAEMVEDRTRRNFCEYFSFTTEPMAPRGPQTKRAADALKTLDALFGGKGTGGGASGGSADARARLESLFKKPSKGDEPKP